MHLVLVLTLEATSGRGRKPTAGILFAALLLGLSLRSGAGDRSEALPAPEAAPPPAVAGESRQIHAPPPPFSEGIFPCSACHQDVPVNRERRKLTEMHEEIVLRHGSASRWCLDCHAAENRDELHLASGEILPFTESHLLCGQCHGEKLRDWKVGVHGKRAGDWNGNKQYLLCAHCHDPHSPRFEPLKPLPPPVRPEAIRPASGGAP